MQMHGQMARVPVTARQKFAEAKKSKIGIAILICRREDASEL
jgi:hypothetical protein